MAEWGRMILKKCRAGTTWESQSNKTTSVISAKERQCIGDSDTSSLEKRSSQRSCKYCRDQMCNDEILQGPDVQ